MSRRLAALIIAAACVISVAAYPQALDRRNNLSDVQSPSTALSNLGGVGFGAAPRISDSFSAALTRSNAPLVEDFIFGSSVTPSAGQTAIKSASDLSTYFNYLEDFAQNIVTGTTMGQDQPFTSTANFVFDAADLALTVTLNSGGVATPIAQGTGTSGSFTTGTSTLISSFSSISSTTGMYVGEIMAYAYYGAYYVSAIADSTHVTLQPLMGAPTTSGTFQPVVFTPWSYAASNATSAANCISFAAVPSGVTVGQWVYWLPGGASGTATATNQYSVSSVNSTQVCVTNPNSVAFPTLASGTGYLFGPPIQVAQIWDKASFTAPASDNNIIAIEWTVTLPNSLGATKGFGNPATIPTNAPMCSWPALWVYSRNIGGYTNMGSEIDDPEFNLSANQDMKEWTGNNHGNILGTGYPWFYNASAGTWSPSLPGGTTMYSPTGGTTPYQYLVSATDFSLAQHKFQFILTGSQIIRYIDGVPMRADQWNWGDQFPMHWSAGMACGAWNQFSGLFFPFFTGEFPFAMKVAEVKVWQQ